MSNSTPAKLPYHIRPMEHRDISRCVDVAVASFMDDELQDWLTPTRREFPMAYRSQYAVRFRKRLVTRGSWAWVCVPSPHAYDHDKILGYAVWDRNPGTSKPGSTTAEKKAEKKSDPWYQNNAGSFEMMETKLLQIELKVDEKLRLNQSIDYTALAEFFAGPADDEKVLGPIYSDVRHWHCALLAVDPQYHRKGVASALMRWGLELAEEESKALDFSVPVTLTASIAGSKLYPRLGFKCVDWVKVPESAPPRNHAEGAGPAFVWDPYGTWIEEAPEGSTVDGKKIDVVWTQRALAMLEKKQ